MNRSLPARRRHGKRIGRVATARLPMGRRREADHHRSRGAAGLLVHQPISFGCCNLLPLRRRLLLFARDLGRIGLIGRSVATDLVRLSLAIVARRGGEGGRDRRSGETTGAGQPIDRRNQRDGRLRVGDAGLVARGGGHDEIVADIRDRIAGPLAGKGAAETDELIVGKQRRSTLRRQLLSEHQPKP